MLCCMNWSLALIQTFLPTGIRRRLALLVTILLIILIEQLTTTWLAGVRTNSALRAAKYIQFVNQWLNDAPAIGLYQSLAATF